MYHQKSGLPSLTYEEAVEEALCFGWIDSTSRKRDDISSYQYFAQRKPKSGWSRLNKLRVAKLSRLKLIAPAGKAVISAAKKSGAWTALDDVENFIMPPELIRALQKNKPALKNFDSFPPGARKIILHWILSAKQIETRKNRIRQTVSSAAKNIRAFPVVKRNIK